MCMYIASYLYRHYDMTIKLNSDSVTNLHAIAILGIAKILIIIGLYTYSS